MTCSREDCPNTFEPRTTGGSPQRFCSTRCRQLDHVRHHPALREARNARYWHDTGWYVRYKRRLERRIQQRLEEV